MSRGLGDVYKRQVLTLGVDAFDGAQAVQVFIGVGGALDDNPGGTATPTDFSDDEINTDAGIGFYASLDALSLVTLKNNNATPMVATDDKS